MMVAKQPKALPWPLLTKKKSPVLPGSFFLQWGFLHIRVGSFQYLHILGDILALAVFHNAEAHNIANG
jgi:hypothetical protein